MVKPDLVDKDSMLLEQRPKVLHKASKAADKMDNIRSDDDDSVIYTIDSVLYLLLLLLCTDVKFRSLLAKEAEHYS